MAGKNIVQYIVDLYKKGYPTEKIRAHLINKKYRPHRVDSAIKKAKKFLSKQTPHQEEGREQQYQQILNFVKNQLHQGYKAEEIRKNLYHFGYPPYLIEQALNQVTVPSENKPPETSLYNYILIIIIVFVIILVTILGIFFANEGEGSGSEPLGEEELFLSIEGLEGGTTIPSPGTSTYDKGEKVIIEAVPEEGYSFSHWEGNYPQGKKEDNNLTLNIEEDKSLIAYFEEVDEEVTEDDDDEVEEFEVKSYTLSLESTEGGNTDPEPDTYTYDEGEEVNIEAISEENYSFSHWEGNYPIGEEEESNLTISIEEDRSLVAYFKEEEEKCQTMECFIETSKNCQPANFIHETEVEMMGMITESRDQLQIKGKEENKCIFHKEVLSRDVNLDEETKQQMLEEGTTESEIEQQEQTAQESAEQVVGEKTKCKYPQEELTELLKEWKEGRYSLDDTHNEYCEKSLPDSSLTEEETGEEEDETEEEDIEEGSKGVFYRVDGEDNDLYLFGTMHFGREDMYPMHEEVQHYLNEADILGLELDLSEISETELEGEMAEIGMYTDPQKELKDVISEETFQQVLGYVKPLGIDEISLNQFKPWYVGQLVSNVAITSAGYYPELSVENEILDTAEEENMEVIGIEEIEDQIEVFEKLDDEGGKQYLEEAIEEKENAEEHMESIATYWKENDKESMRNEREEIRKIEEPSSLVNFYDALIDKRDENMAEEISNLLESDNEKDYFIAVGYLHLVGEESIVENLEDKGYSVKCMYDDE